MKHLTALIAFILISLSLAAQPDRSVWIIGGKKYLGEGFRKWKMDFVFDGRNSFVNGSPAPVGGLRMGLEHLRVHRFGLGFYNLSEPVDRPIFTDEGSTIGPVHFTLQYSSIYYERVLFFNKKWEISGTGHLGRGVVTVNEFDIKQDEWSLYDEVDVSPVELSTSTYYHLTWWFSVGGGIGYRWMLNTPAEIRPTYESTVYLVKVKVRLGKMVRTVFNRNAKDEY